MKRFAVVLAAMALVAAAPLARPASAQRSQQLEFGGYGSFWRFDHLYQLKNAIGGGARFGYMWSDRLGIEISGDFVATTDTPAGQNVSVSVVNADAILNFHVGDQSTVFLTGGYSRLVFGPDPPYDFTENMFNGGIGTRIFLTQRLAVRLEGKAWYRSGNPDPRGTWSGHVQGTGGLSYFFIPPQQGRGFDKRYQWFWGAQGGAFISKTNLQTYVYDPIIGGHWLITARRTALYAAYEQSYFLSDAKAVIFDPSSQSSSVGAGFRDVTFHDVRRLMFGVLAYPTSKIIEPFGGAGFALMQVLNPTVDCSSCATLSEAVEAADRAHDASSKAFFWLMGGLQINYSSKLNIFAHYLLTSSAPGFLLESNTHSLQGGLRLSLGTSKEGITERH